MTFSRGKDESIWNGWLIIDQFLGKPHPLPHQQCEFIYIHCWDIIGILDQGDHDSPASEVGDLPNVAPSGCFFGEGVTYMVRTNIFYGLFHSFCMFFCVISQAMRSSAALDLARFGVQQPTTDPRCIVIVLAMWALSLSPVEMWRQNLMFFVVWGSNPIQKSTRTLPRNSSTAVLLSDCYGCCLFCFEMGQLNPQSGRGWWNVEVGCAICSIIPINWMGVVETEPLTGKK